ncbi:hypothetical protein, partial [Falsiroseomonas oryzae]|uniref:hypothetical protein n=1 Tax=Falsiroseomonas oryzae TaxID=2766473 RepID=UPI0022EB5542
MDQTNPTRLPGRRARNALLGLLLGTTALGGLAVHAQTSPAPTAPAVTLTRAAPSAGFAELVRAVRPAVVQ